MTQGGRDARSVPWAWPFTLTSPSGGNARSFTERRYAVCIGSDKGDHQALEEVRGAHDDVDA